MLKALGSEKVGSMVVGLVREVHAPPELRAILALAGEKALGHLQQCSTHNVVEGMVQFLRQLFASEAVMLSPEAAGLRDRLCEAEAINPLVVRSLNEDDACSPALLSLLRDVIRRVGRQQLAEIEKESKNSTKVFYSLHLSVCCWVEESRAAATSD